MRNDSWLVYGTTTEKDVQQGQRDRVNNFFLLCHFNLRQSFASYFATHLQSSPTVSCCIQLPFCSHWCFVFVCLFLHRVGVLLLFLVWLMDGSISDQSNSNKCKWLHPEMLLSIITALTELVFINDHQVQYYSVWTLKSVGDSTVTQACHRICARKDS